MNQIDYQRKLHAKLSKFSGSFMNNVKWRKLFRFLSSEDLSIKKVEVISIWRDSNSGLDYLDPQQLINFDLIFDEHGIKDVLIGGPLPFKEIRAIVIQSENINGLINGIAHLGRFDFEKEGDAPIIENRYLKDKQPTRPGLAASLGVGTNTGVT